MDLLGSARNGYGKVLLDVVEGVFRDHSVPPNTTRSTRQAFSVWVTRHVHFFPRQTKGKPWKQRLRERTNRPLRRQPSKKHQKPMVRVRHVLEDSSGMDTDGLERVTDDHELVCSTSIHQRSQSTGCVLFRKAPTNPKRQKPAQQVKADCDGASNDTRDRVTMSSPLGQAVR